MPQRTCGQGNIFTPVFHSVHRGGCLPQCMLGYQPPSPVSRPPCGADTPLAGADTPPFEQTPFQEQTPPWEQTPPRSRHPPWQQTPPRAGTPPGSGTPPRTKSTPGTKYTPQGLSTLPRTQYTPPGNQTLAYGQRATGTHPTGMHSCFVTAFIKTMKKTHLFPTVFMSNNIDYYSISNLII